MTKISDLYNSFLGKITDYRLLSMTKEEIEQDLFGYYESARAKFHRCRKSLEVTKDGMIIGELTRFEFEIIVILMLVEHITPQLLSSENLKQSLSDKDFKIYSQANQLREIRLLLETMDRKANRMITEYTFLDLDSGEMK